MVHVNDGRVYKKENQTMNSFELGQRLVKVDTWHYLPHKKKDGYVFQDYKVGIVVYHFSNLIAMTKIKLQSLSKKEKKMS